MEAGKEGSRKGGKGWSRKGKNKERKERRLQLSAFCRSRLSIFDMHFHDHSLYQYMSFKSTEAMQIICYNWFQRIFDKQFPITPHLCKNFHIRNGILLVIYSWQRLENVKQEMNIQKYSLIRIKMTAFWQRKDEILCSP